MPTPEILAYRVVSHPSGSSSISMALPDYAPGYAWDDWFYVSLVLDGTTTVSVAGTPWSTTGTNAFRLTSTRFYDDDDTPWTASFASANSWSALAVMIAFRNGGNVTSYAIGGGTVGGTPPLQYTRDIVPALPQDTIGVLTGLASFSDGAGGMESTTPLVTGAVIYRSGEVVTTVYNDANRWAMWTGVLGEGSTFPADVVDHAPPTFDAANWGTDAYVVVGSSHPVAWEWIDYAANPVEQPPDLPPMPAVEACPPHLQAVVSMGFARIRTDVPVIIYGGTATVRPTPVVA